MPDSNVRLSRNRGLLGDEPDLRVFLFGADRVALDAVRELLREVEGNRCFYCDAASRRRAHDEGRALGPTPRPSAPGPRSVSAAAMGW